MKPPVLPRPYSEDHLDLTDDQWRTIPATTVPIGDLTPSQSDLSLTHLARIANGGPSLTGDTAGRAVVYEGRLWLHDGHHRWAVACLRGAQEFLVRVVDLYGNSHHWPIRRLNSEASK